MGYLTPDMEDSGIISQTPPPPVDPYPDNESGDTVAICIELADKRIVTVNGAVDWDTTTEGELTIKDENGYGVRLIAPGQWIQAWAFYKP